MDIVKKEINTKNKWWVMSLNESNHH